MSGSVDRRILTAIADMDRRLGSIDVAELAAAFGISTTGGLGLLEQCLELRFRLPGVYARFEDLAVEVWKVRLLARLTRGVHW